jgi:hypothetical protein
MDRASQNAGLGVLAGVVALLVTSVAVAWAWAVCLGGLLIAGVGRGGTIVRALGVGVALGSLFPTLVRVLSSGGIE